MKTIIKSTLTAVALGTLSIASVHAHCGSCGVGDEKHEKKAEAKVPSVTIAELKKLMADKKVVIIDVNGTEKYAKGHIPGAIDFSAMTAEEMKAALPADKATPIVAYCGGPKCGAYKKATTKLTAMGYTDVHHLPDGISGWIAAAEEVEKS